MCQILCRIHRQKNHASGKSGKEDRTVYDCQGSHRGGRYSILQDSTFQSDFQIARRRWLRKIHYQIMVMDFSGLCCLDFYTILFGALGYCFVRALYWHNTMSWQYYNMGVLCYCNIMLLGYYVTMLLQCYVIRVLCCCVIMLSGYYTIAISQQSLFHIHTDYQYITILIKQRIQLYYNNLHTIIWYRLIYNICKSGCHSSIQHKTFNIEYLNFGK